MAEDKNMQKLYNAVHNKGLYTKSYDEFVEKYSNVENRQKLYDVVHREGMYTKSADEFNAQYFGGESMQPEEVRSAGAQMGADVKRETENAREGVATPEQGGAGLPLWKTAGKGWSGVPKVEWSPSEGVIGTQEEARQAAVGMVNTDPGVTHYVNDEEREQLRKNLVENRKRSNLPGFTADELKIAVDDAVARENKRREGMMGAVARNGKRYDESTAEGRRMNMLVDRYVGNINTNKRTPMEVEGDAVSLFSLTPKGQDIIARYENGEIDEETYRSEMLGGTAEDMGSFLNANKMALGERNSEGSVLALEDEIAKRGDMFVKEYKSKDKNENIVLKALRSMGGNPAVNMDAGKSDLYDRYRAEHPELVAAGKLVRESKNMISGAEANGFWEALGKGLLHEGTNIDNWASYNKIENNAAIMNVVDKYNKKGEEALNDEEKLLLDAMVANAATTLFYGGKLGDAYKAGAATGASIPFMVEFALLPYSGAESAIGKALTKWGGKIVAKAGGKGLGKVGEFVANKVLPQIGSSLLFTTTADIGKVIGGGMERMNGRTDVTINNETGEFEYAGQKGQQDFLEAMGNAYAEVAAGNYTERALDPFISKIRGAVGGALRKGTYNVSGLGRVFSNVFDNPLMKGAQFEGLLGEFSEEMFNNFLTGAICSDQNIADNFTFDKTKETLEGLLPTQFFFSMFGLGRGAVMQHRANKYVGQEREALQKFFENFGTMPEGLEDNGKIKVLTMEASERMARAMARYQNGEEGYEAEDFDKEVDDIKRAYRLGMSELIEAAAEERAARLREERVATSEQLRANAEGGVAALTSTEEQIRTNNERINGELEKVEAFRDAVASFRSAMEIEEDLMNELSEESGLSREQLRVILNKQSKDMSDDELAISDRFNEQKAVRTYTEAEVRRRTIETKGKIGRDGNITNIEVDGRKGVLISTVNGITVWRDEDGNLNQCTNDMVKVESVQNADEVLGNVESLVRDEVTTAVRHTPGSVVKYGDRFYVVGENDGESVELLDIADPKNPQSIKVGVSEMAQVPEFRVKRNSVLKRSGVVIKDYDPDTNTYETSAGKKTAAEILELANQGREVLDNLEINEVEEKKEEEAKAREEARSETVKGIVKKAKEFAAENREVAGVEDDGTLYINARVKEIEKARAENEKKLKKAKGEFVDMTDAGKREKAKVEIARLEGEVAGANGQIAMYEEARGLLSDNRVEKMEERLREEASELRREEEPRAESAEGETPSVSEEQSEQERVEEMAGKLGVKVRFASREELGNEEVEGYFNVETGEIVLCPENCEEGRMEFVLFHETVGHYGLRQLFKGNEKKMGEMLDAIYAGMSEGDKSVRISECMKNPRWEKMSERDRVRLVAEEHFARTAEEYLRRKELGTLNEEIEEKAKSIFERFMEVLRELFGVKAMGFDDVMALAAASARNLEEKKPMTLEEEEEAELREIEAEVDGVFERAKESDKGNVLIGSYKGSVQAKANRLEKKIETRAAEVKKAIESAEDEEEKARLASEFAAERARLEHELDMQRRRLEFVELRGKTNDEIEEAAEKAFLEYNKNLMQPTKEQQDKAVEEVTSRWEKNGVKFSSGTIGELKKTAKEVAGSRAAVDMMTDTEPRDVSEVAAWMLGGKGTKLTKYDWTEDGKRVKGGIHKGVMSETGMGESEMRRFPFKFVPNRPDGKKVLTVEDFAGKVKEMCDALKVPCEGSQEARNAVIEVIQGAKVPTDFKEYIVRGRMSEARGLWDAEVNMTESELMRGVNYSVKPEDGLSGVATPENREAAHERTDEVKADDGSVVRKVGEGIEIDAPDGVRYSIRVYHGSAADFKEFDHSFMGSGEGAQAYGWGTYVSSVKGISKAYADTAKRNAEYRQKAKEGWGKDGEIFPTGHDIGRYTSAEIGALRYLRSYYSVDKAIERVKEGIKEMNLKIELDNKNYYPNPDIKIDHINNFKQIIEKLKAIESVLEDIKSGKSDIKYHKEEVKPVERHLYEVEIPDDNSAERRSFQDIEDEVIGNIGNWYWRDKDGKLRLDLGSIQGYSINNNVDLRQLVSWYNSRNTGYTLREEEEDILRNLEDEENEQKSKGIIERIESELGKADEEIKAAYAKENNEIVDYLDWDGVVPGSLRLIEEAEKRLTERGDVNEMGIFLMDNIKKLALYHDLKGGDIYKVLEKVLGSDKKASLLLSDLGVKGVKVSTNYHRTGHTAETKNYVIFNEKDARIVDNVMFSVKPEEVSEVVGSDVRETEEYERSEEGKVEQEKLSVSGGAMSAVADAAAKRVAAVMANEPKYGQVEGETMIQFFGRYNKWYEEMRNKKIEDEEARREYERVFKAQVPMIPQFEGSKMTVMEYMKAFEETRTVLDMCRIADDFNKLQAQRREVWLKLERVMWERNNMLRKWQSDVAKMLGLGEELPEQYDVLGALNRMSSVVNERAKMYENGEYKGLVDAVAAISREAEVTWGARERQRRKGKMFRQNVRRAERVSFEDVNGERWEPKWTWQNVDDESTLEGDRRNGQLLTPVECIELYLQAKDALEAESLGLADRGLEGFANQIESAGDVNVMSAERVVAEFEEHIGEEKCLALQKATREATVFAMDELLRGGLISQAQYNQTLQYDEKSNTYKRQHYVPQRGWAYEAYLDQSMFGDAMKAAKGRSTLATSPLAYIDIIAKSSIQAAEKNLAKMKLWQLTQDQRANGELSRAFVAKRVYQYEYVNPQTQEKEVIESLMPPVEGMSAEAKVRYNNQKKYERDEESTVRVQVEGVIYDIHINDKQVARNINGMYANEKTAKVLDGMQRALTGKWFGGKSYNDLTKFFSALKTQFNPVFAFSNLMRDMGFAFTINTIEHGYGFAAKALGNSFATSGVIHDYLLGKLDESGSKYADMFREFKDGGGITGYSFATDLPELRETMAKAMERAEKRAKRDKAKKGREAGELGFFKYLGEELRNADLKTAGESVKGFVERISQLSELMTRFGQYVTARESGMSVEESVNQAKEITTNFNRSGEISAILGPVYYFTNATLQGGYRIIRAGMKHPGKLAAHCAGWMLMGAIAAILQPDDPDDERYIADYVWQTYLPIGKVKIPLPHFFRTMFYMGANIAWAYQGRKTAAEAVLDGVSNIIEDNMASPLKLLEYVEMNKQMRAEEEHWYDEFGRFEFNVKRKIRDMVPSLIQPVSDTSDLFNMMFTGAKIHKEKYNENDVVNDTQMHFDNTDPRFVAACEWLQRMTGGTNNPKDNRGIALNPGDVQYIVGQYASGAPLEVLKLVGNLVDVANIAAGDMDGKDFPWDKTFLFGRFYQPYKQDQMEDAYYWNLKKTADAYASFEKGFKETDREEYRKWKGSERHDLWKETKHTLKPINKKMQAGEPLENEEIEKLMEWNRRWNEIE